MKMFTNRAQFSAQVLNSAEMRGFIDKKVTQAVEGVDGVHKFMTGKKRAVGLIISTQTRENPTEPGKRAKKGHKRRPRMRKAEKLDGLRRVTVAVGRLTP